MYKAFYGMHAAPFGTSPDPRFLYVMPQTRETLACLQYGIAARKGFVVMTGEVGTGKTTMLKTVLQTFNQNRVATAFVFNPRLDELDFLEFVMTDFGIPPKTRTKSGMLIQLNRWLIDRFSADEVCVIVVDEAQNLSWELLEEIRLLTNLETSSVKLLQIVLSGQPELEQKLRDPSVRQLRQRVSIWCKTRALIQTETAEYVTERLRIAGAGQTIFDPEAVNAIYLTSQGIPRVINLVCENSLINAYVEQLKVIPARIVEAVAEELGLDRRPFVISPEANEEPPVDQLASVAHSTVTPIVNSTVFWKGSRI